MKTEKELSELTQNALKEEEDRKKRIENRQKLVCVYNVKYIIYILVMYEPRFLKSNQTYLIKFKYQI